MQKCYSPLRKDTESFQATKWNSEREPLDKHRRGSDIEFRMNRNEVKYTRTKERRPLLLSSLLHFSLFLLLDEHCS